MTTKKNKEEGTWGSDPRGVKFVSFEISEGVVEKNIEFRFPSPERKEEISVNVTNQQEILGIIVLFKPNYEEI